MLVLMIMLFLSSIVANTLMSNQIEDKTYENAMLRCLGWSNWHIVLLTIQKSVLL